MRAASVFLFALVGCSRPGAMSAPPDLASDMAPGASDGPIAVDVAPARAARANLLPVPASLTPGDGAFVVDARTRVLVDPAHPELMPIASTYAAELGLTASAAATSGDDWIGLSLDDASLGDEGYRLTITPSSIRISANRPAGAFYAVQTLRQLAALAGARVFAEATIVDRPRFAWRGLMLDVARHFFPPAAVERWIDLASRYKINRLHLHLSDDQGWRLDIHARPRLASVGGMYEVGGDAGGYFTQTDYAAITAYAAARFVTVVPETDLPAHCNAALTAYAELNCSGNAPAPYTGTSSPGTNLCVTLDAVWTFLDDLLNELGPLSPSRIVHLGGDEARTLSSSDYASFVTRAKNAVTQKGLTFMAWEDAASAGLASDAILQLWRGNISPSNVAAGTRIVMSPLVHAYLDQKYDAATPIGSTSAGYIDVDRAYQWDPTDYGFAESDVLGVEAPLWTERVVTVSDGDLMIFPRLLGIAEIGWSPRAGRSYADYAARLVAQGKWLAALGVGFYRSSLIHW